MSAPQTDLKTDKKPFSGKAGPGRPKGLPNKTTTILKDAILKAAEEAGGKGGMVAYLKLQATENPSSFLPLLGKVLPMQVTGVDGEPIKHVVELSDEALAAIAAGKR